VDPVVLVIFALVYGGMILGEIPGLALDRTGIALLGAIALVVAGRASPDEALQFIDVPTLSLLFGLMVVSAQFRLGGFYSHVTRKLAGLEVSPPALLAWLIGVSGLLSALLANDVVCLAMAPVLIEGSVRRKLDPVPFLLALACASNVGSALTLIGNPQNMLIGESLRLSFRGYLLDASLPSLVGLAVVWLVIVLQVRGRWEAPGGTTPDVESPPLDRWQTAKGLLVLGALLIFFLSTSYRRDVAALAAAGVLLSSRYMASREILGLVDWHLLVLFIGLFVVNGTLSSSGTLAYAMNELGARGIDFAEPGSLFMATAALSNLVSNVPAVMLLLPYAQGPGAGAVLALSSTLAGNLFVVGSIANIIVIDQARRLGVEIGWRRHARVGVPVTVVTLALAWIFLWLRH
jgi:Na+/H+ antiporter NhaD/arsenite permease-like protein